MTRLERQDTHRDLQGQAVKTNTAKKGEPKVRASEITATENRKPARSITHTANGNCQVITILVHSVLSSAIDLTITKFHQPNSENSSTTLQKRTLQKQQHRTVISVMDREEKTYTRRAALLIGNSAYSERALTNPINDINAIERVLIALQFTVIKKSNLGGEQMRRAIQDFASHRSDNDLALFYFGGHGLGEAGGTFFLGTDFMNAVEDQERRISAAEVQDALSARCDSIIFADCCRNDLRSLGIFSGTLRGLSDIGRGLLQHAVFPAPTYRPLKFGIEVLYATTDGSVALDAGVTDQTLSPLAAAICENLSKPIALHDVIHAIRREVTRKTQHLQKPQTVSDLNSLVYLAGKMQTEPNHTSPSETRLIFWNNWPTLVALGLLSSIAASLLFWFLYPSSIVKPPEPVTPETTTLSYEQLMSVSKVDDAWLKRMEDVNKADEGCTTLVCQAIRNWKDAEQCAREVPERLFPGRYEARVPDTGLFHTARQDRSNEVIYMGANWHVYVGGMKKILAYDCHWSLDTDSITDIQTGLYDVLPN